MSCEPLQRINLQRCPAQYIVKVEQHWVVIPRYFCSTCGEPGLNYQSACANCKLQNTCSNKVVVQ